MQARDEGAVLRDEGVEPQLLRYKGGGVREVG